MRKRLPATAILALLGAGVGRAADLDVEVRDAAGGRVPDAMIEPYPIGRPTPPPKTGADGRAVFHGLPATGVRLALWHPCLKAPGNHIERSVPLSQGAPRREGFGVPLRGAPRPPAIAD